MFVEQPKAPTIIFIIRSEYVGIAFEARLVIFSQFSPVVASMKLSVGVYLRGGRLWRRKISNADCYRQIKKEGVACTHRLQRNVCCAKYRNKNASDYSPLICHKHFHCDNDSLWMHIHLTENIALQPFITIDMLAGPVERPSKSARSLAGPSEIEWPSCYSFHFLTGSVVLCRISLFYSNDEFIVLFNSIFCIHPYSSCVLKQRTVS